jgi:hypothetical protein
MSLKTVLIQDARIADITDEEHFAVLDGASQSTFQNFAASTQTSSSIVWNIQIPSENVVIDRHLLMQSTVTLTLTLAGPTGTGIDNATTTPTLVFDYGLTDSLQAFPLNALCLSQQMSINNSTISQNTRDIMPMILRMTDKRKLNKLNSSCPSLVDAYYSDFNSGVGCINNVLASYNNQSLDEDYTPRGAYNVSILNITHTWLDDAGDPQADKKLIMPINTTKNIFTVALSPWINASSNNMAGLVGINNISCNLNIDSTCKRVFSTCGPYLSSITLGATVGTTVYNAFTNSKLLFNFLSLQSEQYAKISSKNVVPYLDFPRYLTSSSSFVPISAVTATGVVSSATLTSNSLQLNQIPDLILICVRKPMSSQTWTDPNFFLTINSISISFNNTSGILSTANQNQLYNISVKNGSSQTFYEFSGFAGNNNTGTVTVDGQVEQVFNTTLGTPIQVGTTGSMLVLNPSMDFNLPSYLSASSLGQYNLYFSINVSNQTSQDITPEICVITVNSGLFTTQLGSSIINTGLLTKEDVLKTKEQKPTIDSSSYKRYIGGVLGNFGSSNVMKLFKKHAHVPSDDNKAEEAIIQNGVGSSLSGGRISKLKKHYQ